MLFDRLLSYYENYSLKADHNQEEYNEANFWLKVYLHELNRIDNQSKAPCNSTPRMYEINNLCNEITLHPEYMWIVGEMAMKLHYSKDHFIRLFKRVKGLAPNEFIIRTRIDAAIKMIKYSSYSINYIAELIGYKNTSFFIRQFKKYTGTTPLKYRSSIV
jgi:AraC-like DNA-binding protein